MAHRLPFIEINANDMIREKVESNQRNHQRDGGVLPSSFLNAVPHLTAE